MAALPMKIAISGSAGTGKTTLATALAAKRGCSFVAENFDNFFDDNAAFIKPARRLQQRIIATLEQKDAIENDCGDFVADRCAIDLFNLWLSPGYGVSQKKRPNSITDVVLTSQNTIGSLYCRGALFR